MNRFELATFLTIHEIVMFPCVEKSHLHDCEILVINMTKKENVCIK